MFKTNMYPEDKYKFGLNIAAADFDRDGKEEIVTGLGPGEGYPAEVTVLKPTGRHTYRILSRFTAY